MKTFRILTPLFAGALLLAAGPLAAQGGPEAGGPRPGGPGGMGGGGGMGPLNPEMLAERLHDPDVVKELGLSQAQLDKIDKLAYDAEKNKIDMDGEARMIQLDMRTLFGDGDFDAGKAQVLVDRWAKLQEKLARQRMAALIELRKVFTTEQWRKLRQTVGKRMRERMQEMRGGEGDGPRPGPGGRRRQMRGGNGAPPPPDGGQMEGGAPPQ